MDLLRLAIKYYLKVTNKNCTEFYKDIQSVFETDIESQQGDDWLRHKLLEQVINNGSTLEEVISNKDKMLSYFGVQVESDVQEYSVDPVWGKEVFKLIANHNIDIDNTLFWDINCLSDSLFPAKIKSKNVYMSHYNESIIGSISKKHGTSFCYDFINCDDLNMLPQTLKEAIEQNKPLVILCCLPIKKDTLKNNISDQMYEEGYTIQSGNVHYQYLYRIMQFVDKYKLSNSYIGFFGDTELYTNEDNKSFYQRIKQSLNFKDGFCFSLRDFNSTLLNVNSLHFSLWKVEDSTDNPILLTKKRLATKTKIEDGEKILFEINNTSLIDWLQPTDVLFYTQAPIMLNYATFKGGEKFEKKVNSEGNIAKNALGTMVITDDIKNISKIILLSSVPTNKSYINITEENFWRCVATFAFSCLTTTTWGNKGAKLSAPNTRVEGFEKWCKNAILLFLFDNKAMFSNLRNVQWQGVNYTVENKMFFIDKDIMEMFTDDMLIKKQIRNGVDNSFIISKIYEARKDWDLPTEQLYEFVVNFVQRTMSNRKEVRYIEDTDSWNAGFLQLKSVFGETDTVFKANFHRLYSAYMDYLRPSISKFGFLQDR